MKIINKKKLNAFLAMPVTDSWDSNRVFRIERQKFFKSIIRCLKKEGYEVSSAGTNENWGKKRLTIKQFTKYDVDSIKKCDLFVLVTCERITSDMYLEIGIVLTRNRPILLIIPASARVTHLLLGLNMMKHIFIRTYDSEPHALILLKNFLSNLRLNIMKYCAVEEKIDQRPGLANQD